MTNNDFLISIRRTLVPIVVGIVSGSVLSAHIDLDALEKVVSGLISGVYYVALRLIETHVPGVGFFLGARRQPVYVEPIVSES